MREVVLVGAGLIYVSAGRDGRRGPEATPPVVFAVLVEGWPFQKVLTVDKKTTIAGSCRAPDSAPERRVVDADAYLRAVPGDGEHGGGDRDLQEILAQLSHELRTPISAIVTLAELLRSEPYGPLGHPKYAEYVESIGTGADHALKVLAAMLQDAAHADVAGEVVEVPTAIGTLLDDCLRMVGPDAASAGVVIERVETGPGECVRTDPAKLRQILINLLNNAQKFSPDGGSVRVGHRKLSSGEVEIFVRDNGLGMARSSMALLLREAGAAGTGMPTTQDGGGPGARGLGFAVVRSLASACGATFRLTSARGRGTLARLRFAADRVCPE